MKKLLFLPFSLLIIYVFWQQSYKSDVDKESAINTNKFQEEPAEKITSKSQRMPAYIVQKNKRPRPQTRQNREIVNKVISNKLSLKMKNKNRVPSSFEQYFSDETVQIDGHEFLISDGLRSLPVEQFNSDYGIAVSRLSGYVFYESNDSSFGQPALYQKENRSPVVLTGRVILKNISKEKALQIATKLNTNLDTSMAHLGVYAVKATNGALTVVKDLGKGISSAEIVTGGIYEK